MNMRRVMAYSAHVCTWVPVLAIDIGRPDDTRIPAESHPAVIEDDWLANAPAVVEADITRRTWQQGTARATFAAYLDANGPVIARKIAVDVGCSDSLVSHTLSRHPDIFAIVDYVDVGKYRKRTAVWGLKREKVSK